jgi:hypothetical protein
MTELQISSIGPPPPLHADRVVGLMMGHIIKQAAHIHDELQSLIAHANDGGPRAQKKLQERLLRAGEVMGRRIVACDLEPAKRGRYHMRLCFWSGWDRDKDREIEPSHKVPRRPWVCLWYVEVDGLGNHRVAWHRAPLAYISHHVLSRMAQRRGLRDLDDLFTAIARVAIAVMDLYQSKGVDATLAPPPSGWHIPLKNGAELILAKHETKLALVAVTVI